MNRLIRYVKFYRSDILGYVLTPAICFGAFYAVCKIIVKTDAGKQQGPLL